MTRLARLLSGCPLSIPAGTLRSQRRLWDLCAIVFCVIGASCGNDPGGSTSGPAAPTPTPTPTPTSLALSGPNTLRTGQSGNYTAVLSLSNGTTQNVTPNWTSDADSVLTINSSGQGNALAHGSATVAGSTQGVSSSTLVRVYQDYQGTWTGAHRIRVCDERGAFVGICRAAFRTGTVLPFQLRLTQTAGSATGTVLLGEISTTMNGAIFDSRRFVGGGSGTFTAEGLTFTERIGTLDVLSNGTALSGSMILTIEALGFAGNTYIESDLSTVSRTSSSVLIPRILSFSSVDDFLQSFRREPN